MIAYTRIRLAGQRSTVKIEITAEDDRFLRGYEVNSDGEKISGRDFDQRLHVIEKCEIAERTALRMNLKYARLETVK
jgi:hypothetical protein